MTLRKEYRGYVIVVMLRLLEVTAYAVVSADTAAKFSDLLMKAPAENYWQVKADDVYGWMQAKKTDFVIIDVRPESPGQQGGKMPGAIYIPYNEILKAENLKKLPKTRSWFSCVSPGRRRICPCFF